MKKDELIFFLVILLIISNIVLGLFIFTHLNKKVVVVIPERVVNLINVPIEEVCPDWCEKMDYDGWFGTGGTISQETICDCYHIALYRTEEQLKVKLNKEDLS